MCILDFNRALMYEFHFDYIKNKYSNSSRLLFTDTDNLMYKIKTEEVYEDFSKDKEMFEFSNYSTKSKYYYDSKQLVVGKMKYKTADVAIKGFFWIKAKYYLFLVDDNGEHKKAKGVNKNVVVAISHNEYKDVFC